MNDFNPDRIELARECRGWNKKELAGISGLSASRISNLVNRKTRFTESDAERLAFVTGFPIGFFVLPDQSVPVDQLTFRKLAKMKSSLANQAITEFQLLLDTVTKLESMTHACPEPLWLNGIAPRIDPSLADIERLAGEVRTVWGLSSHGPVKDVTRSMERSGILVVPLAAPISDSTADGVSSPSVPHAKHVIGYFPEEKPGDRQRFTDAHELGHLVLHRFRRPKDHRSLEFEANAFAGALLMPEEDARASISKFTSLNALATLKAEWGVSIAALIARAGRLGIYDAERQKSLRIQMANRKWNKQEPIAVKNEHPTLFKQVLASAFSDVRDYRHPAVSIQAIEGFLGLPAELVNHWCGDDLRLVDGFPIEGAVV
ncbi:helix-turn-helix domain-containing protein [Bifidobacterium sp. DSM 109958]|uniref:Helix-turn-helix domain-containing protein n=3 Tax=Bifidobacterium TaxID=1678 RepID=A0A7Y0EW77_9BIFI|nr:MULTISPECIES: XRE family transcriptional regulator [Bifidobacterium]NMM97168.1 helix-turn-helix domain-containing protein [Bifidobacterium sp. DSM 109959]NMN00745.1 helix-turn-helix domain-containing protein [Bifidobacterium sp. DSM 109958]